MASLIGTAVTDHLAKKGQPGAPASHGRRIERGGLIFVYRAAFVGLAAFGAALVGFGLQEVLPAAYLATSKSMIGSIVGLIASLLSIVLGLLVWTSHGQFISQQTQLQTIAVAALQLDDEHLSLPRHSTHLTARRRLLYYISRLALRETIA